MHVQLAGSAGYVDDAVDALSSGSVYVSREVDGSTALADQLQAQVGDASIGIAVFSDNAALEASGPDIVSELADRTGFDTIIVAVGDDLSAGSRVLESGEAMRIANQAESAGGTLEESLSQTVQTIVQESAPAPAETGGGAGGVVIALAIAAAVVVAGVIAAIAAVRARRARTRRSQTGQELPDSVRGPVDALRALSGEYAALGGAGNQTAAETAREIDAITANAAQLFARLAEKGAEDQFQLAEIEYGDKLGKLSAALDRRYLLDILVNPHLWDDPDERVVEVRDAVDAVSEQLVDNIKQVNARRGLHFQVSLDTLSGRRKELRDWDREFRRADGAGELPSA
ncbi:hypothetical protein SAMN04487846_2636 [Microbacterium sp. cf046]|uniref:hypothetical protein n=1 Tax=Microbacterium sp. cf046 TaxID=1761803 RepID=UPI0008F38E9D|nr:hypothetical protein [Microbacterium sp. cf046]SFS13242.1 hypothetical protein SAMN04487846_2636 [Microbacterium sp. cf046]